ncbi:glycoside hydrolase family 97 protein [Prolixibacteraceae bacterium JC049]|nr:glycoside hydrolase family 97 protein [Prolixibacteraceae bacterium JC049]
MKFISISIVLTFMLISAFGKDYKVLSPNGQLKINVSVAEKVTYKVYTADDLIVDSSEISMTLQNGTVLGEKGKVRRAKTITVNETITPIVKRKFDKLSDHYNQLTIDFKGGYSLVWRAYDEGVAYRWTTKLKKDIVVKSEQVNFAFTGNHKVWFPEEEKMYSHQEREYVYVDLKDITAERFASTGLLVELEKGRKAFISESDLEEYPGMFLKGNSSNPYTLTGKFAGYPLKEEQRSDRDVVVTKHADFLAKTVGTRAFPWRLMVITNNDAELLTSELVYKLAKPLQLEDASWVKPGMVAWDWWNALNIYGVDFESGVNTATYKYYIDFASKYGLEYIILDEGWYNLKNLMEIKKQVNLKEIIDYGKEKNVGVILWTTWKALEDKTDEAFEKYAAMGAKGFKVDFMQRDDQWMVNYYHRIAKKAAEHKMLIDYHGSYKPAGLRRAYPNVITREGVLGLEQTKWGNMANPEFDLILPFTRMVSGPMDYTPGAMINKTKRNYKPCFTEPMSAGTRCHQLGMYVVFESPLQMLADNPSNYLKEEECMEFLSEVPTVWDDTKVLDARVSDYVLMARRSGEKWFMGAMTDWTGREMNANLDFLGEGEYTMVVWEDGVNADKHAADYQKITRTVTKESNVKIKMAKGGGWTAILYPKK